MSEFGGGAAFRHMEMLEVLLEIKEQGMHNFNQLQRHLEQTAVATALLAQVTEKLTRNSFVAARAIDDEGDQLRQVKTQAAEASAAMGVFAAANTATAATAVTLWHAMSFPTGWAQVLLTGLVILFGPLLAFGGVLLASTSVMFAWVAGASAMILVLGGLAAGFGLLGAAIFALGWHKLNEDLAGMAQGGASASQVAAGGDAVARAQQRLVDIQRSIAQLREREAASRTPGGTLSQHQQMENLLIREARAQDALNEARSREGGLQASASLASSSAAAAKQTPLARFKADFETMADALEKASVPLTLMMMGFVDSLFPMFTTGAQSLIYWFGARLPGALAGIRTVIRDLLPDFQNFSGFLGRMFDQFSPEFGPRFEQAIRIILPVTETLLDALGRLTLWFFDRLPEFGPVVQTTFSFIGNMVLAFGRAWGAFADWGARTFFPLLQSIKDEWDKPGVGSAFMNTLKNTLPHILEDLDTWIQNSPKWLPVILDLAETFLEVADAVTTLFTAIGDLIMRLQAWADNNDFWAGLQNHLVDLATWLGNVINPLAAFFDDVDTVDQRQNRKPATSNTTNPHKGPPTSGSGPTAQVVQNFYGLSDPQQTARLSARVLRNMLSS